MLQGGEDVPDSTRIKTMEDISRICCPACGKPLTPSQIKPHLQRNHPEFNNKCLTCDVPVNTWDEHVNHAEQFHEGRIQRKCNSCEAVFNSNEGNHFFKLHIKLD